MRDLRILKRMSAASGERKECFCSKASDDLLLTSGGFGVLKSRIASLTAIFSKEWRMIWRRNYTGQRTKSFNLGHQNKIMRGVREMFARR